MALYEAVIFGRYYNQAWNNKLHFETVNPGQNAQSIADILAVEWVDRYKAPMVNDVFFDGVSVKSLSALGEQFTHPLNVQGSQAGEPQSVSFKAGVIQKKTGLAGRANRGRIYAPGIRAGATHQNIIDASEITFWAPSLAGLKAHFINPLPHDFRLVIKHPEGSTPVTDLVLRPILGVMRSRNTGVGS